MKIVLRGRGGGKTTELIRISARTNSYIVAMSRDEAGRILAQAQAMGLDIPYPITFDNFLDRQYSSSVTDDVDSGTGGE